MSADRETTIRISFEEVSLDEVLKTVAEPLTDVALRLEQARLKLSHGEDPFPTLASARDELEKAFVAFERGRARLLHPQPGMRRLEARARNH